MLKNAHDPSRRAHQVLAVSDVIEGATSIGSSSDAITSAVNLFIDQQSGYTEQDREDLKFLARVMLRSISAPTIKGPVTIDEANLPYIVAVLVAVRKVCNDFLDKHQTAGELYGTAA